MKKVFMTLALIFSVSLANSSTMVEKPSDCEAYAGAAAWNENWHYNTISQDNLDESYFYYYRACMDAGGSDNISNPVFL